MTVTERATAYAAPYEQRSVSCRYAVLAGLLGLLASAPTLAQVDSTPPVGETQSAESESDPVAEQTDDLDTEEPSDVSEYTDGPKAILDENAVFKLVAPRRPIRDALLTPRFMETLNEAWQHLNDELEMRARLRLGLAYTFLAQWTPDSDAGKQGIGGDLDFTGVWNALGSHDEGNAGYLGFATEWRHGLGSRPPSALASQFDAFSLTTQAFNEQEFALVQLWWAQEFFDDTLEVTAGQISPRSFYNTNLLRNQNVAFLNQAFSGNRAVGLPPRGLGVNVAYRPVETWYLTGGVHDANGSATAGSFDALGEGQFASIGELGWTPTLSELGRGNYRLTLWYSDASREHGTGVGKGFALSFDQAFGAELVAFMRYAWADGDARGADQALAGGIAFTRPFGRENDLVGLGLGWSEPSAAAMNEEVVAEVFYRLQLTQSQQLSVGWQAYITPAFNPDEDIVNVFSVRWRIQY
jgi:hypothetical protein